MVASIPPQRLVSDGAGDPILGMKKEKKKKPWSFSENSLFLRKRLRDSPFLSGPHCVWMQCSGTVPAPCQQPEGQAGRVGMAEQKDGHSWDLDDIVGWLNQRALKCVWPQNFQIFKIINFLIAYAGNAEREGACHWDYYSRRKVTSKNH